MEEAREGELYYDYIWQFMEVVNNNTEFNMVNPLMAICDEYIRRPENETNTNDLQIFYDGSFDHIGGGHFFTIYFDADVNIVFVYDSLRTGYLSKRIREIMNIRYPKVKVHHVVPKTKQPDGCSCGVMASAYATGK